MSAGEPTPRSSVIIPAHNEAAVITRCLRTLLRDATPGEFEVIVVANGCTDDTATLARAVAPDLTVLELATASKIEALNAGDAAATGFPRVYLDADVEVDAASLRTVLDVLATGEVMCAAPEMRLDLEGRPWFVRSFFRAFLQLPYLADGLVGNGLYALSESGRRRFDAFPEITADDLFVRNLFGPDERAAVAGSDFVVHPPITLGGLLAIRERTYRGNREYHGAGFEVHAEPTRDARRLLRLALRHPLDAAVFAAVNLTAKVRLLGRRRTTRWERDDSARR